MSAVIQSDLICDVGMSEGNDTDFYLNKGFRVVGVEADPEMAEKLKIRFATAIAEERLTLLNRAAAAGSGQIIDFFTNSSAQGHSRVLTPGAPAAAEAQGRVHTVSTIDWPGLMSVAGVPYYCKVDIEGHEKEFLSTLKDAPVVPTFLSAEVHSFAPIELMYAAGYRQFRLLNQTTLNLWRAPNPAREGKYLPNFSFNHASGFFGRELPGSRWYSISEIAHQFHAIGQMRGYETLLHGWFDCHAYMPPS